MRWLGLVVAVGCLMLWTGPASAGAVKIKKVLPHFLDKKGRHTLSPSLYERDAYQAYLRRHPELCSGIRFDVLFRAPATPQLLLRLELRGSKNSQPTTMTVDSVLFKHGGGRGWRAVTLSGESHQGLGELVAWRASLREGEMQIAEQKSFLW